jgi:hypothetical protein
MLGRPHTHPPPTHTPTNLLLDALLPAALERLALFLLQPLPKLVLERHHTRGRVSASAAVNRGRGGGQEDGRLPDSV